LSWTELKFITASSNQETFQTLLENLGALAVTTADAGNHPILEPGVGETPLWPSLEITALFDQQTNTQQISDQLVQQGITNPNWSKLKDQDWERTWMDDFKPMDFGHGLWIVPSHMDPPQKAQTVITLDPGLAFGTGTHPTTAMCLNFIAGLDLKDQQVLDFGCGSGILAIAALKLGARLAYAIDNDPQALTATQYNAQANNVELQIQLIEPEQIIPEQCDLVVANILAGPLLELAPLLAQACRPGGRIVLSGILREQATALEQCYANLFTNIQLQYQEDWVLISACKPSLSA